MTGLELWLAQQVGAVAAGHVVRRVASRSFPGKLVGRVRRHSLTPELGVGERMRLRGLIRREETWQLLLDRRPAATSSLSALVESRVVRPQGSSPERTARAGEIAAALQAETPGALEMEDALAVLSHQVTSVGDSVAAVHTDVRKVEAGVQSIAERLDRDSAHMDPDVLLRGPLEALELSDDYDRAQSLAETDPVQAATLLGEIAQPLEEKGYGGLARPLRVQRAQLLTGSGFPKDAAASWMPLVLKELADGAGSVCREAVAAFRRIAHDAGAPAWLPARAQAVEQLDAWFRNPGLPSDELLEYARATLDAGDPAGPTLLLLSAEAALADGDGKAILSVQEVVTRAAETSDRETATRLLLTLAEVARDEGGWQKLLEQADPGSAETSTRLAAMIYARRGRFLFWAGDPEGAAAAYRSAVERACRAGLWQDAAEWMLSLWRVLERAQVVNEQTLQLPARAVAVRATGPGGLLQRGYDPHTAALRQLLAGKLSGALPELRRHLRDSVRVAHLEDELEAHHRLGELYEKTAREPAAAIGHLVQAGDGKEAARVAQATPFFVDCSAQADATHPQTRAAALQATAAQADLVPDADVDAWVERSLRAANGTRGGFIGPQEWVQGFAVLAGLSRRIRTGDVSNVLAAVEPLIPREENHYTWADDAIVEIVAGLALGHPDRRSDLARCMIAIFDESDTMARRLIGNGDAVAACLDHLREPLRNRARAGNRQALQALALQGDLDPVVTEGAEAEVSAAIDRPPAHAPGQVSGLADVAMPAYLANCLGVERRVALARDYVERALDEGDIENNRAQAADGCRVLAGELPQEVRDELFDSLLPTARGEVRRSPFDELADDYSHPLSAFQIAFGAGHVRRAAVLAVTELAADGDRADLAAQAARELLKTGDRSDSAAAARGIYNLVVHGHPSPIPWPVLASSADPRLRQVAVALLPNEANIDGATAQALAQDVEPSVRRETAMALDALSASDMPLAGSLADLLVQDPRFSVRSHVPTRLKPPAPE